MFLDVTAWTMENIVIRIAAAFILGALIGIDRGPREEAAVQGQMLLSAWERQWS